MAERIMRINVLLVGALACAGLQAQERSSKYELPPEQRTGGIKRIFVLCHSHLDIGFTRPPDEVARDYKDNIDAAIRLTRDNPDFRWTIESAWMLEEWLRRTEDESLVTELGNMLRQGRMGLGVAFANMHSGLIGAEEIQPAGLSGREVPPQIRPDREVAYQNDVPGFSWAYPRVLAGSGVKYLVTGLNLFIGGGNNLGAAQTPFYWMGPDGSRVLTYFTYESYVEGYRWNLGGRFPLTDLERTVPRRLAWLERNGYKYDTYMLMASPGDNTHPEGAFRTLERIREWNRGHPELPMKMVLAEEFFDYLQERYGDSFSSASGDAAGHWEIVKLRVPEAAPKMRQVGERSASRRDGFHHCVTPHETSVPPFRPCGSLVLALQLPRAHRRLRRRLAGVFQPRRCRLEQYRLLCRRVERIFGHRTDLPQGTGAARVRECGRHAQSCADAKRRSDSDNGLSWTRGGPALIEGLPAPLREGNIEIIDRSTGEQMPWEAVPETNRHVQFFPKDVPAIGYRIYEVRKASQPPQNGRGVVAMKVEANAGGWIASIIDSTGRQMVRSTAERPFGSLLLARGREGYKVEKIAPAHVEVSEGRGCPPDPNAPRRHSAAADRSHRVSWRAVCGSTVRRQMGSVRDTSGPGARFALALPLPPSRAALPGWRRFRDARAAGHPARCAGATVHRRSSFCTGKREMRGHHPRQPR